MQLWPRRWTKNSHPGAAWRAVATVTAAALIGAAGLAAAPAHASPQGWRRLAPVLVGLNHATELGAAPPGLRLTVGVSIQRPDPTGEQRLYSQLYDPSSPLYHHFLTPAQFAADFGVPSSESSAVVGWLRSGGLRIQTSSAAGDYFTARGTVAQLDQLFRVSIDRYSYGARHFVANSSAPSVPASLPIDGVLGLDTLARFSLAPLTRAPGSASSGVQGVLTPQDLWGVYGDPVNPKDPRSPFATRVDFGQGQSMGIFGEGESSSVVPQLRLFEKAMGLPKIPVRVVETEGGPDSAYGDSSGAIEWYLDSQASTGMAPDASELELYFAKAFYDADVFADFDAWANDPHGPRQMNASFGECEQNPTNPVTGNPAVEDQPYGIGLGDNIEAIGDPILRQATLEGRTLFASAGDTGSGCPEAVAPVVGAGNGVVVQPVPMVSYPCVSPYVVCVGGTVVSTKGSSYPQSAERAGETSWTFGGGGSSYFVPEPAYQRGVPNVSRRCLSTPSGSLYPPTAAPICRGVPDVADMSGNVTGDAYFIYVDGEPSSEGGTSLSSPLMMGQWARIQAAAPAHVQQAGGLGFADELIYRQARRDYARDFYDVTQSEYGVGNGAYAPGPGWDYASGWGALNVSHFLTDVDGTTDAALPTGAPEQAAREVGQAVMTSPVGNATDPLVQSLGNQPSLDLTRATLSASATRGIVATLSGPGLGSLPPPDAGGGNSYTVAWYSGGKVWYARAYESPDGSWSFTSGNTGTYGQSSTYGYNDNPNSSATGKVDADTGTITIVVPASEVGSPKAGSVLVDPQAFDDLDAGTPAAYLALTTDYSDDLVPVSQDGGASVSRGEAVTVGN